jgi:hypothetical protein
MFPPNVGRSKCSQTLREATFLYDAVPNFVRSRAEKFKAHKTRDYPPGNLNESLSLLRTESLHLHGQLHQKLMTLQDNHTLKAHSCKSAGVSSPNPDSDNNEQEPEKETPGVPEVPEVPATPRTVMADDDKQIRVSVYWYTQPLKKNKGQ